MTPKWHLIYTNPRKESLVAEQLDICGAEVFYPTLKIDRGYNRGVRTEALFPHYLFVRLDLNSPRSPNIRYLPGVRALVHLGGQPVEVPEAVIDHIRQRVQACDSSVPLADHLYKPGQSVRIRSGPLAGLEAVFQAGIKGTVRAQVLLEVLGSLSRVKLDVAMLEPA